MGIDTLYLSEGEIPPEFLLGCGVPSVMVDYIPSLATPFALEFYSAFISYSHADRAFAEKLEHRLKNERIGVWRDEHGIVPGDDVDQQIDRAIRDADRLILVCSRSSLENSWWVDREITRATDKEERLAKVGRLPQSVRLILPVDVDGFLFSDECTNANTAQLRRTMAARFEGWETDESLFETHAKNVIRGLRPLAFRPPLLPKPKLV